MQDIIHNVKNDSTNYIRFEQMTSSESYQVMQDFANSLPDDQSKTQVLRILTKNKSY
ncbi:hypothetical protein KFZ70_12435 [Tamlana fucoidanivorans]|uniref:hypothetical protein n=1 Tax=Allotamlana fucoidanivorans TaxID=2583814 RepID=UPI0013053AD2|nr:hypothetical protein [Tamlana fucoidanivorans]